MSENEVLIALLRIVEAEGKLDEADRIKTELYVKNEEILENIVRRYRRYHRAEDIEDLSSVVKIAFMEALRRYDESLGPFLPYLIMKAEHAAIDWTHSTDLVSISRDMRKLVKLYRSIIDEYQCEHSGRTPSDKTILVEINKNVEVDPCKLEEIKKAETIRNNIKRYESLSDRVDVVMEPSAEDAVLDDWVKSELISAICNLPELTAKIILYRYFEGKTQSEIAEILGMKHKQTVSKKEKKALRQLSKCLNI